MSNGCSVRGAAVRQQCTSDSAKYDMLPAVRVRHPCVAPVVSGQTGRRAAQGAVARAAVILVLPRRTAYLQPYLAACTV